MDDFAGNPIRVGSRVAWFKSGRYDAVVIGTVAQIKTQVQVEVEHSSRPASVPAGSRHWAPIDRVVVIGGEQA